MSSDVGKQSLVVIVEPAGGAELVPMSALSLRQNTDLVRDYLTQGSPRSRATAFEALRRIVRFLTGLDRFDAVPPLEYFDWVGLTSKQVTDLRAVLTDQSRTNEVTGEKSKITPGTANLTLSHLRSLIARAAVMGFITPQQAMMSNPKILKNIRGSREKKGRSLSPDEERKLRAAVGRMRGHLPVMLDAAFVLAIGGGLRREEVTRLTLGNIEENQIKVVGKGNKERIVSLDESMKRPLNRWLAERATLGPTHSTLFCSAEHSDQPMSAWSFWSLVRKAAHMAFSEGKCSKECACTKLVTGPHDFRRTFATRLLEMNFDLSEVQKLMGHESITTTTIYDKRSETALHEKRRKVSIVSVDSEPTR